MRHSFTRYPRLWRHYSMFLVYDIDAGDVSNGATDDIDNDEHDKWSSLDERPSFHQ